MLCKVALFSWFDHIQPKMGRNGLFRVNAAKKIQ